MTHNTICVVAAHLAERAWTVMRRGAPDAIRDTDGRPVTPDQAKAIIAERWPVPPARSRAARQADHLTSDPP